MSGHIEDRLRELKSLPELKPPAERESLTLSAMAEASARQASPGSSINIAQAAAIAVLVGAAGLLSIWLIDRPVVQGSPEMATESDAIYYELIEQSAWLEQVYAQLPPQRRVMRADTASTIVGLEDRIALIDAAIDRAASEPTPPEYRVALMQNRIEVMNALVNVRYAQSRAFTF